MKQRKVRKGKLLHKKMLVLQLCIYISFGAQANTNQYVFLEEEKENNLQCVNTEQQWHNAYIFTIHFEVFITVYLSSL